MIKESYCMTLAVSLACLVFSGCGPQRIAKTVSGRPEVTIHSENTDLVKSAVINEMQILGFLLSDDSKYRLVFTKQMEGGQAMMAQLALGNSYSTTPVAEVSYNITKIKSQIKVVGFSSMSTQMAFGQVNRYDMENNNVWFNNIQSLLQKVKTEIEGQVQISQQ